MIRKLRVKILQFFHENWSKMYMGVFRFANIHVKASSQKKSNPTIQRFSEFKLIL